MTRQYVLSGSADAAPLVVAGGRRAPGLVRRRRQTRPRSVDLARHTRSLDVGQGAPWQSLLERPLAPELGSLRRRDVAARVVVQRDAALMALRVLEVALHGRQRPPPTAVSAGRLLCDVSYTAFNVQRDDSYTGRGTV